VSDEQAVPGTPAGSGTGTPSDYRGPPLSEEFFLRVNDFIQMANRIEKRYDSHHAQLAMLHGFSRYSGHHYRTTSAATDDAANREAFAEYMGGGVKQLILGHLEDMIGAAPAQSAAAIAAAAATAADAPTSDAPAQPGSADPAAGT
jgi:hypothetical protein